MKFGLLRSLALSSLPSLSTDDSMIFSAISKLKPVPRLLLSCATLFRSLSLLASWPFSYWRIPMIDRGSKCCVKNLVFRDWSKTKDEMEKDDRRGSLRVFFVILFADTYRVALP